MNRNYRNNLYSNSSESSRKGGGSWVYINGELYHYGRPGMEWGKHLPGTEWWKEKTDKIKSFYKNAYDERAGNSAGPSWMGKTRATIGALGSTAKYVGQGLVKYGKKLPGHMVKEVRNIGLNIREDMKDAYKKSYESSRNYIQKIANIFGQYGNKVNSDTKLSDRSLKECQEFVDAWKTAKEGTIMQNINFAVQAAQYAFVSGVDKFMRDNNTAQAVDSFLKKLGIKK